MIIILLQLSKTGGTNAASTSSSPAEIYYIVNAMVKQQTLMRASTKPGDAPTLCTTAVAENMTAAAGDAGGPSLTLFTDGNGLGRTGAPDAAVAKEEATLRLRDFWATKNAMGNGGEKVTFLKHLFLFGFKFILSFITVAPLLTFVLL